MIKEFWQERKEEKKRLKEIKKQNKKLPKSKEEKAYRIFGIIFVLFLIFGSIFYTCSGGDDDFSWNQLNGISSEMIIKLEKPINRQTLIKNKQIDSVDWGVCKDSLASSGVLGVVVDNEIDTLILSSKELTLSSTLVFNNASFGALSQNLIYESSYSSDVELVEALLTYENEELKLTSLVMLNLGVLVMGDNLPYIYVTTSSVVKILNDQMYALNSVCKINDFNEEDNAELLEVIEGNSIFDLEFFTNELIANQINFFADGVNAKVRIKNSNLEIY